MPGCPVDQEDPLLQTKTGSARTSKKSKRRKTIRYLDWSGQQESVKSSRTEVQQQSQDIEDGDGANLEFAGETIAPREPVATPDLPDHQKQDTSPASVRTNPFLLDDQSQQQSQGVEDGKGANVKLAGDTIAPKVSASTLEFRPLPSHRAWNSSPESVATDPFLDDQTQDARPLWFPLPPTREETDENSEYHSAQEDQNADDSPSENIRPNAQNLRYGGYPTQPAPQNRNTPLGSGRLQNTTKLGAFGYLASRVVQWNADAF